MSNATDRQSMDAIAIVGIACRFPGARTVDEFWRKLTDGVESITFFTDQELLAAGVDPQNLTRPNYVKARGVLEAVESFDAAFFGINPRDAEITDPQQRVFLEAAWEALESAGYDSERCRGRVGVFAGMGTNTYLLGLQSNPAVRRLASAMSITIENDKDYVATRVAYKLNLRGPAMSVQTACSTSLVAVCLAAQSLLNYQSDMALAGGVSIRVPQLAGYFYNEGGIMSPDGHCRPYDHRAHGTTFCSGVGVVVLKRVADALADGDTIHAIIRGFALNNDGSAKVGFTAPSVEGQSEVIAEALAMAGVGAENIGYVEGHGTATAIGDPIEVTALTRAYRAQTQKTGYCALGSVKSNMGHTDAAAGVAGLIKAALSVKHGLIVPSLHFERPNPQIDFENSPFYVSSELKPWPAESTPRRAGVSSFGVGGTNAHCIVEEPPTVAPGSASRPWQLLLLSARSEAALEAQTENLRGYLEGPAATDLADVAYTLQVGRRAFGERRIVVCRDREDAVAALQDPTRLLTAEVEPEDRSVVFAFPGGGAQYVNMGRGLYESEPVLREEIDRCAAFLEPLLGLDIRDILHPGPDAIEEAQQRLSRSDLMQPVLFTLDYALARLWMSWGVLPEAMIGHSLGEYVAACLAGVFTLEDALTLVTTRARLVNGLPAGAMTSVPLAHTEVQTLLGPELSLAAANGPALCVLSGSTNAVEAAEAQLAARGITCRRLHVSHPFHSVMLDPILAAFEETVRGFDLKPPAMPFLSNVTGRWITAEQATDPGYWVRHLRGTVQFASGTAELLREPGRVFLEVGPGRVLSTFITQQAGPGADRTVISSLRHPQEDLPDLPVLLRALGQLWMGGVRIDWPAFSRRERRLRVPLPTYPFERQRYWVDLEPPSPDAAAGSLDKKADVGDWFYAPSWRRKPLPEVAADGAERPRQCWALFMDTEGLGAEAAKLLQRRGDDVVRIGPGAEFARTEQGYELDPSRPEDYASLLGDLREQGRKPTHVLHLWGVTADEEAGESAFGPAMSRGFDSLLLLAQSLGAKGLTDPLRLAVVTTGLHEVMGDEVLSPAKAVTIGPCRVIPQEYPFVTCRAIDVVLPAKGALRARLAKVVLAELEAESVDPIVAYRGAHRWAQAVEKVRLEPPSSDKALLRDEGVYLITGGLGGVGLTLAEFLARTVHARLVLVGRSGLPEREGWARWVEVHGEDDDTARKIRKVEAIEALGSEVLVLSADVASREEMAAVVKKARKRFGTINGLLHAAGVEGRGIIQLKTLEAARAVFTPKVQGALVIEELSRDLKPDFVMFFSSLAAILGGVGQVDYCAANACLDAEAVHASRKGRTRVMAVNWDAWAELGMAFNSALPAEKRPRSWRTLAAVEAPVNGHPLFVGRRREGEQEVSITRFETARHWVVGDHRIMGRATLVGTAYLEMARAALEAAGHEGGVELRDVFFLAPLTVADDQPLAAETVLTPAGEGFRFLVRSMPSTAGPQDHAMGTVTAIAGRPERRLDLAAVRARCPRKVDVGSPPSRPGDPIRFGGRWRSMTELCLGEAEALATLELPSAFRDDLRSFHLHPALMDVATGFAKARITEGLYLPFSYKRLTVVAPLGPRLCSHVRHDGAAASGQEVLTFDVTITDDTGRVLVEIEGYSMKRVPESVLSARLGADKAAASAGPADGSATPPEGFTLVDFSKAITPGEGVEAFRRLLSLRNLPQVAVSTRELQACIDRARSLTRTEVVEKLEKQKLPRGAHARPNLKTAYLAPRNAIEQAVAEIWQSIIGIEQVGIHDGFIELGGHSLLAIQVMSRLRETFQVDLPVETLFKASTVAQLSEAVLVKITEQTDEGTLTKVLAELEALSEDEARAMLSAGKA
jgi:acyl transferase domain-containing protein/acyl carrier protein